MAGCRERAALGEGLSKGPRQDWAGSVQGTVRRLSALAPASLLHLFTRTERGYAAPWGRPGSGVMMSQDVGPCTQDSRTLGGLILGDRSLAV